MYIGGLDVGSSGAKITVYDDKGTFIESHYHPYDAHHTSIEHTIDAHDILNAVKDVISMTKVPLEALGVTSFGESFVMLDEKDNILNRPMLYNDQRGEAECKTFDPSEVISSCLCTPAPLYTLPKLMWMKNHRPDLFERTKRIMMVGDFIVYLLTGNRVINYSSATRTMGFNVLKKSWDRSLLDHIGVDPDMLSFPVPDGTLAGVSNQFGLCNTKIISAMHDQNAAAIGAGALRAGDAVNGSGSVECLTPVVSELPDDGSACKAGIAFLPYVDGLYVGCAFSYTGGTALKWFHDNLGAGESYSELDSRIGNNPGEILLLPHFAGAATPYMDPGSKAMFWGITLGTTKYDLYRAVMEGVAYEMRINLDLLAECGIKPARLLATGGGAKSKIWTQIKSDVTGLPITIIDANEVGAVGVIMTCARTLGLVGSLDEAAEIYVKESETLYPNEKNRIYYSSMYEKYKKMYQLTLELR